MPDPTPDSDRGLPAEIEAAIGTMVGLDRALGMAMAGAIVSKEEISIKPGLDRCNEARAALRAAILPRLTAAPSGMDVAAGMAPQIADLFARLTAAEDAAAKSERRATRANARADVADKARAYQRSRAEGAEEARDSSRRHSGALRDRLTAAEAERVALKKKVECPIGIPEEHHEVCSAGTCYTCIASRCVWSQEQIEKAAEDRVIAITAERDRLRTDLEAARVRGERMERALQPFADWSAALEPEFSDHENDVIAGGVGDATVTFGNLRQARAALADPARDDVGEER